LTGLSASEWPELAAVPGVWFRLVSQAALALHTIHNAGLAHGHLRPEDLVFTADGILKLCNSGEPPWLADPPVESACDDPAADLQALGALATRWANPARGRKAKPLPEPLANILKRLEPGAPDAIPTAAALLQELDAVSEQVPPNPEAWNRFVQHVRRHAAGGAQRKQSA
jgi:hypothetical protein